MKLQYAVSLISGAQGETFVRKSKHKNLSKFQNFIYDETNEITNLFTMAKFKLYFPNPKKFSKINLSYGIY